MSRTYKKFPMESYFRTPRGRRNALRNGVRSSKVPPDGWDDIHHDSHCYMPYKVARRMAEEGWPYEAIVDRLRKKWRLSFKEAEEAAWGHDYHYPEVDGQAVIYREEKCGPIV